MANNELMLEDCPFCGGAARIHSNRDWHRVWVGHDHHCALNSDEAALMYPATPEDLAAMIEKWNRRAAPAQGELSDAAPKLAHGHREDYYLMANARRVASRPIHQVSRMTNAHFASELFATGSTSGHRICVDAGIDPDGTTVERVKVAAIQAQASDAPMGGA